MDKLIYDRTQSDVTNKTSKGYYNASDLNRVEAWCEYLKKQLNTDGYNISFTIKTDWTSSDLRSEAQMERIRKNIIKLMTGYHYISLIYANNNNWNYTKANRWEKILQEIYDMMLGMEDWAIIGGIAKGGHPRLWQNRFRRYALLYFPVTYIESAGNCEIDTGIVLDSDIRIVHTMACLNMNSLNNNDNPLVNVGFRCKWGSDGNGVIYYGWGSTNKPSSVSADINNVYIYDLKNGNQYIADANNPSSIITSSTITTLTNYPKKTIRINNNIAGTQMRTYEFKAYKGNDLILDLIPALDKNNEPCLYDQVGNLFYYNRGTGSFLYG